jgi:hypothetical protein
MKNETNGSLAARLRKVWFPTLAFALFTILILGVWELYRADAPYAIRVSRLLGIFLAFLSLAVTALVTAYINTRDLLAD